MDAASTLRRKERLVAPNPWPSLSVHVVASPASRAALEVGGLSVHCFRNRLYGDARACRWILAPSWEWSPKEGLLGLKMLALLASATPSLSLSHAESRVGCEARRSFCAALSSPNARAFELALLLAAEERPCEDVAVISNEVEVTISALAEKARSRLQLESLVGGDPNDPKCIAAAASRVLFGSGGAGAALFYIPRGERRAEPATAARDSP